MMRPQFGDILGRRVSDPELRQRRKHDHRALDHRVAAKRVDAEEIGKEDVRREGAALIEDSPDEVPDDSTRRSGEERVAPIRFGCR